MSDIKNVFRFLADERRRKRQLCWLCITALVFVLLASLKLVQELNHG